ATGVLAGVLVGGARLLRLALVVRVLAGLELVLAGVAGAIAVDVARAQVLAAALLHAEARFAALLLEVEARVLDLVTRGLRRVTLLALARLVEGKLVLLACRLHVSALGTACRE